MEKVIKLYNYVNGVNDTPFPDKEEQVEIFAFDYNANRMGGAPSITAKVKHRLCLDNLWTDKVYGIFNGEKYFIVSTPSSSKSNTDERYEHEVQLLSEREVLNHVYFIDAVQGDETIDRPKSNTTKVQFMGDIKEFVGRLNSSLQYRKVGYNAVIDEGITSENKLISFEDKYIAEALQEAFTQYNIPYYFNGKTIHFGYTDNVITAPLKYGSSDALLGISKTNANYQIINRITGVGSADNIPYYYPNESEKGKLKAIAGLGNRSLRTEDITITKMERFAKIDMNEPISYSLSNAAYVSSQIDYGKGFVDNNEQDFLFDKPTDGFFRFKSKVLVNVTKEGVINVYSALTLGIHESKIVPTIYVEEVRVDNEAVSYTTKEDVFAIVLKSVAKGQHEVYISYKIPELIHKKNDAIYTASVSGDNSWHYKNGYVLLDEIGISITKIPQEGDSFHQERVGWITPSPNLMPTIYRNTLGAERFYNAKNNTYKNEEGTFYDFENEWSVNKQLEGKVDFPDIKPSIVGMTNASGQRIDQFIEFAYDEKDDESYDEEKNEYVHSYFFAKMRKTDGKYGFNLFDQANEKQTMQVSMLEGVCGACTFEIGVGENTQKNIVQVDAQGNLLRDKEGNVIRSGKPQPQQNDTRNNEVWIALKKDENTYPTFKPMPNATHNLRPKASDKFVLLGITMPQAYIDAAEKRLEDSLIKYMWMNNREKFNISIKFSRIYFAEHPEVLSQLNENSRVLVEYNGDSYTLYIDDYSYKMDGSSPLPEIEVNLVDTLTIGKNSLQAALDSVKQDILSSMGGGGGDFLKQGLKYFLRKDISDTAKGLIRFLGGAEFGQYLKGVRGVSIDELGNIIAQKIESHGFRDGALGAGFVLKNDPSTNRSYMEVDELFVRVKAFFTELEIKKLSYAGGNWIFSPAGMTCSKVGESEDGLSYRCYFVSEDKDTEIKNEFEVNDLVRCQEFNIKEGNTKNAKNRYFWRKCVKVGKDFIDLSKDDCDPNVLSNDAPKIGDSLVTLGNTTNKERQNAIIISAYGEGSPSITQYTDIDTYSLKDKEKIRISPTINKFTGEFVFDTGENVKNYITNNNETIINTTSETVLKAVDGKIEAAVTTSKEYTDKSVEGVENSYKEYTDSKFQVLDGKIDSKVSNEVYIKDKNGIDKKIKANETNITQTAEQIKQQATSIETIDGQVKKNTASIELNSKKISLKVGQDDVDKSIDGINLGVRNILRNSRNVNGNIPIEVVTVNPTKTNEKKVLLEDGTLQDNDSFKVQEYPVGDIYEVSVDGISTSDPKTAFAVFLDNNNKTIKSVGVGIDNIFYKEILDVPTNAVKMLVMQNNDSSKEAQGKKKKPKPSPTDACFSFGTWLNDNPWKMGEKWKMSNTIVEKEKNNHVIFYPSVKIKPNEEYILSIGSTTIKKGFSINEFEFAIYDNTSKKKVFSEMFPISSERKFLKFTTPKDIDSSHELQVILYTGTEGSSYQREMEWNYVKLEEGNKVSQWTEAPEDNVSEEGLLATGIDIENKKITLTADKTLVQDNSGRPIALFSSNTAEGIQFNSNVYCNYIRATKGTIAGFTIASNGISYNKDKNQVFLGTSELRIKNESGAFFAGASGIGFSGSPIVGLGGGVISSFKMLVSRTTKIMTLDLNNIIYNGFYVDGRPIDYLDSDKIVVDMGSRAVTGYMFLVQIIDYKGTCLLATNGYYDSGGGWHTENVEIRDRKARFFIYDGEKWHENLCSN